MKRKCAQVGFWKPAHCRTLRPRPAVCAPLWLQCPFVIRYDPPPPFRWITSVGMQSEPSPYVRVRVDIFNSAFWLPLLLGQEQAENAVEPSAHAYVGPDGDDTIMEKN